MVMIGATIFVAGMVGLVFLAMLSEVMDGA
jgi:hypothetical protein